MTSLRFDDLKQYSDVVRSREGNPVTLRFVDLNGDHLPDMVIEVQGSQVVFLNDQGSFRLMKPSEQNQIIQRLLVNKAKSSQVLR